MATREVVMARINLFGVLRSLQELVALDAESRDLVMTEDMTLEFVIRSGIRGVLRFSGGRCDFIENHNGKVDIRLFFTSPAHFNRMMDGAANPIPLKGLFRIGFLTGPFTKLTDRLSHFLRPADGALEDPEFFAINTKLTAFVAFHALAEVGNWDELGRLCASQVPDGVLQVRVEEAGGPTLSITAAGGRLSTNVGVHPDYRCLMWFKDLRSLSQILNGEMDAFTVFGQNRAGIRGFIPMADKLNPLLGLLPGYLE